MTRDQIEHLLMLPHLADARAVNARSMASPAPEIGPDAARVCAQCEELSHAVTRLATTTKVLTLLVVMLDRDGYRRIRDEDLQQLYGRCQEAVAAALVGDIGDYHRSDEVEGEYGRPVIERLLAAMQMDAALQAER